jgi:cytochrome c553
MNRILIYISLASSCFGYSLNADAGAIQFHRDIRPIFEQSCVECHGPENQKSDFRVDDYESLLKGGESEIPAVVPGDLIESLLIEVIEAEFEEDRMPPEGKADPLTVEQIAMLKQWVTEGAEWEDTPEPTIDFVTQVQPIFQTRCYVCHGPDKQEVNLRTDLRTSLLKGGDTGSPAIVPGKIDDGELLKRIHSDDKEFRMPRDSAPLSVEEKTILKTWIAEGAIWPGQMDAVAEKVTTDLWSMQPIVKPDVPRKRKLNPIDMLLNVPLNEKGIAANGVADPATLIRRASIVLTGLPPAPERIEVFVTKWNKNSKKAYNALLGELFDSPHFGERWAQHWLDVIRWAETTGYESNEFRKNAWPYRDYVVDAFNQDKPYDHFIREQLAGDQFGQDVAMGFLVAGPHAPGSTVGQNPDDQKQARFDRLDETIQTVGSSMMGVTMGCARCHNHKFDPVSIADYYSMAAVFNDIEYDHRVPKWEDGDPRMVADREVKALLAKERAGFGEWGDWTENWVDHLKAQFPAKTTKSIRFNFKPGNLTLDEIQLFDAADSEENLALKKGVVVTTSKLEESITKPPFFLVDNRLDNFFVWKHEKGQSGESKPWVRIDMPKETTLARADLSVNRLAHYAWQFMINKAGDEIKGAIPKGLVSIEILNELGNWETVFRSGNEGRSNEYRNRVNRINALAIRHVDEGPAPIFAGKLIEPTPMHVMHRGSPLSPKAEVAPMGLEVLDGDFGHSSDTSGPERRVAFANWLTQSQNPLTARVMVNRLWYHVFGAGIVTTPGDFGFAGGIPSHPELLDWLASDFIDEEWSVKTILRKIVTTDAFKRSSAPSEEWLAVDADAKLLWRFPPRWLEAEVLRDSILVSSGAIDLKLGGLGYHIYKPKIRYDQWKVVDNSGPHTWRRMLYQQRMRRVDDQMFTAFDFPSCAQVQSKRPRSTTPLQALNLMNGKLILEQAELLAERAIREGGDKLEDQLKLMFKLTLGREPKDDELTVAADLATNTELSSVGRMLFNLNEFFYLN